MGKNGNGEGTIKERKDGRWEARYHDVNGNHRSVYGKTRKDVAGKLAAKIATRKPNPSRPLSGTT